jgi:hypothetical protein
MKARFLLTTCSIQILLLCFAAFPVRGADGPVSGLYRIVSGRYSACCGIAGNDFGYDLPTSQQSFVWFKVDQQSGVASMAFLADDLHTVFSTVPCPVGGEIAFKFKFGSVLKDRTVFHADPGPPPYYTYWYYTASNFPGMLRIDGTLGTASGQCADVPTRFGHSNVVAVLVPGPRLTLLEQSKDRGIRLMVQGNAGWTNVIEVSTNLTVWTPVSTNYMTPSLCPICPYAIFEDPAATNAAHRFYRAFDFR